MNNSYDQMVEDKKKEEKSGNKGSGGAGGGDLFMKTPEGRHQIRLVGDAKVVYIHWTADKKKLNVDPKHVQKMRALKIDVRKTIVSNVIDREDQKKRKEEGLAPRIKILEKGNQVFKNIITRYEEVLDDKGKQIHPGGPGGCDWVVKVSVPVVKGQKDIRSTEYNTTNLKETPFTNEELALIAKTPNVEKIKSLLPADKLKKVVSSGYAEKYKDLPLGEKGLIDLDAMYDPKKHENDIRAIIAEKSGEDVESEEKESAVSDDSDDSDDMDLGDNSNPVDNLEESSDKDLDSVLF
jgi:hypothetical protein